MHETGVPIETATKNTARNPENQIETRLSGNLRDATGSNLR
jgi:hypothetical protein